MGFLAHAKVQNPAMVAHPAVISAGQDRMGCAQELSG
jgi:hypothetical protein